MNSYVPVLLLLLVGSVLGGAMSFLAAMLGPRNPNVSKSEPVECGLPRVTDGKEKMSVKFYMTAILFILFDIETVFLYLWAKVYKSLGWFGFVEGLAFMVILVFGLVYVWRRGALEWD